MANKTLGQSMYKIKLKERFERVERLPENYQARMILLADGLLEEAEKERKRGRHDESAYLCSMPDMKQSIIDGMNTPVEECITDVGL